MGDVPPQAGVPDEAAMDDSTPGAFQGQSPTHPQPYPAVHITTDYQPTFQQHIPHQQYDHARLNMAKPQVPTQGAPYNMTAMANALPQSGQRQYHQGQQQPSAGPSAGMPNQIPFQQYGGQPGLGPVANQQYYLQQQPQMPSYYPTHIAPSQPYANMPRPNMGYYPTHIAPSQPYANMPRPNMGYYPTPAAMSQPAPASTTYYYTQMGHFPVPPQGIPGQVLSAPYISPATHHDQRFSRSLSVDQTGTSTPSQDRGSSSSDSRQNVVRGPPRKPRQSGHAIWIGNLPPQTDLMNLVHHVCKETSGLESLFLISKSNCAFANFKDEESCSAAQQKLHDSRFETVRLVSRLRKSTVEGAAGVSAPTGPAASTSQSGSPAKVASPEAGSAPEIATSDPGSASERSTAPTIDGSTPRKDAFFVLKSLTLEDLELSVRTGIWATQSHNEETLNKAFESVDNVYLIFSANKSGEYFGYARMVSPINDDPTAAIEFAPRAQSTSDLDLPKAIPTEATEFAPKGRIIDDSARGTIFWEAERDGSAPEGGGQGDEEEVESGTGSVAEDGSSLASGLDDPGGENKAWGKPFKLEWLSTSRLPFHRTRGLRNPWNSNREVKIARDGTELEPSVGRRLIGLFNKPQNTPQAVLSGMPGGLRGQMPMMPGFPPARHPYPM